MKDDQPDMMALMMEHWRLARTLRSLRIQYVSQVCIGCEQCFEVCPSGCWRMASDPLLAVFIRPENCVACGACVLQCPVDAIKLE